MRLRTKLTSTYFVLSMVLVLVFSLTACSSSDSNSNGNGEDLAVAATDKSSLGLSAAAKLIAQAIIDADGDKVYAQISGECQSKLSRVEISKQLRTVRAYLTTFLGASMDEFSVEKIETRQVKAGESGQARYTINVVGKSREVLANALKDPSPTVSNGSTSSSLPKFSFDEPTDWFDFVYEGDTWRLQSCEEFLVSSGVLTNSTSTSTTAVPNS